MQVEFATVTWPIFQLIIVIVVTFFLGAFLGFYSFSSETKKKVADAEMKAQVAVEQAKGEAERAIALARATQPAPEPTTPASMPGTSLLRLWLDEKEWPRLDLDGAAVETSPISEHNRRRLIALLNTMRPWIEAKPAAPASVPTPVAAAPSPAVPAPRPIPTPPPAVTPPLAAKKEEKPSAPLSMVGQIDEILQERLVNSPLASRGIKLLESPEGAVIVMVGLQKFNGVGEVTDPQIQSEIRAAIAEWEKKYTPGL